MDKRTYLSTRYIKLNKLKLVINDPRKLHHLWLNSDLSIYLFFVGDGISSSVSPSRLCTQLLYDSRR